MNSITSMTAGRRGKQDEDVEQKVVISGFDYTGNAVKPWAEAGYLCYCIDTQHPEGETREGNIIKVRADMRYWIPPARANVALAMFWVPCTHTAVSGARWFEKKGLRLLAETVDLWYRSFDLLQILGCPGFVENPTSVIASYEPPTHSFHPYEYSTFEPRDWYTKKTHLWAMNGFVMPEPAYDRSRFERGKVAVEHYKKTGEKLAEYRDYPDNRIHFASPGEDRANFRSATPMGFTRAMFEANRVRTTLI